MRKRLRFCSSAPCFMYCLAMLLLVSCGKQQYSTLEQRSTPPSDIGLQPNILLPDDSAPYMDLRGDWLAVEYDSTRTQDSLSLAPRAIKVPANWYTEGLDYAGAVSYERRFFLPKLSADTLLRLVFEGVDYEAEVWLNGKLLGKHTGYFQPFSFVANESLKYDAENILRVRVNSPNERSKDWSLHKRLVKGIFGHHDTRPGGAWSVRGQDKNTGGIWGNVYLSASQDVALESVECTSLLDSSYAKATIHIRTAIRARDRKRVVMQFSLKDVLGATIQSRGKEHFVQAGLNLLEDTVHIHKPLLWYTHDVGKPNLYSLSTQVYAAEAGKAPLATRNDKFGIREIRYDTHTGEWRLNGKRLFLRGTNYIGTQFLSTMNRSAYDRDALLMVQANVNAVRVHAHIARKEWYDACDSLGLLIWQDFPLQWGYADDAEFVQTASNQVRDMIHCLYNHPSIATWCLHNEPPFDADWMQYKYPDYQPLQNAALNTIMTRIARRLDTTRYVHPFSATREHHWEGWYFGHWTDYAKPVNEHLVTEFGAQALPNIVTLETILGEKPALPAQTLPRAAAPESLPSEKSAQLANEAAWKKWEYHNFQHHETFDIAKVSMGASVEEFVHNSQEHQRRVTELAAESYRLQRYKPVGAAFQFMFVEDWASMNWGIVDYLRNPKPAYEALRQAYQPTLITNTLDTISGNLRFFVINDRWQDFPKAHLFYTLETNERTVSQTPIQLSIPADAKVDGAATHLWGYGTYRLKATLLNDNGDTLSRCSKTIDYHPRRITPQ